MPTNGSVAVVSRGSSWRALAAACMFLALFLVIAWPAPARATTLERMSIDQLSRRATMVVEGTGVSTAVEQAPAGARGEAWPPKYFWGYVTDSTDGNTLYEVVVKATQPGTGLVYTTSTDAAGKYRLDLNPDPADVFGEYNVEYSKEGYQTKRYHLWLSLEWTVAAGPTDGRVDEALTPTASPAPTPTPTPTPTPGNDDDIPGVAIPSSPFDGSVAHDTDLDDVFRIALTAGQTLTASITGPSGSDFRLYLYAPGTASVKPDGTPYEAVAYGAYPCSFTHTATQSGTYYLDVYSASGAGGYTVTYSVTSGDTVGPRCAAKNVTVKRGKTCRLYFKVHDALSAKVTTRLVIKTKSGVVKKRWSWGYHKNSAGWWWIKYTCRLRRGTYRIVVTGKDLAGNRQSVVGRATLKVR